MKRPAPRAPAPAIPPLDALAAPLRRLTLGAARALAAPLRPLALGAALACAAAGCTADRGAEAADPAAHAADDPWHLQDRFERVVAAARAGERDAILALFEPLLVTRDELVVLFGPAAGEAAWPGYSDQIAGRLRVEAADVIIERVRDGFDAVEVERVGPAYPDRTTPGDERMLEALVPRGLAMYTVRLRAPNGKLGLRFNGFVYHDGRWRALLKTYDYLPAPDAGAPEAPADAAPTGAESDAAPPAPDAGAPPPDAAP